MPFAASFFLHEKGRISRHLNFFSHRKSDWIGAHFPTKKRNPVYTGFMLCERLSSFSV
ncbi:hypothetical protein AB434_2951 [Heyndrickxia coagulans]|nr:hypothetical protein AB434_2951 [Heyndrickxia coagulans]